MYIRDIKSLNVWGWGRGVRVPSATILRHGERRGGHDRRPAEGEADEHDGQSLAHVRLNQNMVWQRQTIYVFLCVSINVINETIFGYMCISNGSEGLALLRTEELRGADHIGRAGAQRLGRLQRARLGAGHALVADKWSRH